MDFTFSEEYQKSNTLEKIVRAKIKRATQWLVENLKTNGRPIVVGDDLGDDYADFVKLWSPLKTERLWYVFPAFEYYEWNQPADTVLIDVDWLQPAKYERFYVDHIESFRSIYYITSENKSRCFKNYLQDISEIYEMYRKILPRQLRKILSYEDFLVVFGLDERVRRFETIVWKSIK